MNAGLRYYGDAIKKYVTFKGRATRKAFWFFVLYNFLIMMSIVYVSKSMGIYRYIDNSGSPYYPMLLLYELFIFLPFLSLFVRRLHDLGMSGWFAVLTFIPYIGQLFTLIIALIKSEKGDNKYGVYPHPPKPEIVDATFEPVPVDKLNNKMWMEKE